MHRQAAALLCVLLAISASCGDEIIYDSKGFEEFEGIFIDGQDGWFMAPDEGVAPLVWTGPPSKDSKSVQLRVFKSYGEASGMERKMGDLLAEGYAQVTIAFDVYREVSQGPPWFSNLWWGVGDNGYPSQGGQWNADAPQTLRTYPLTKLEFYDEPWVDAVIDDWATISMTWDFDAGIAYGYYDGMLVSQVPIEYLVSMSEFYVFGIYTGKESADEEYIYIDNFIITGEKAGCYPDCDGSGGLDLFDFLCFVGRFNAGEEDADCDGDGAIGLFDFFCFVNAFNQGCG